jgi:hypothetical protein
MTKSLFTVIPGRAKREPGIQSRIRNLHLDSGLRPSAGPGMTELQNRRVS